MEVGNWNPRPGQVWLAHQKVRLASLITNALRRNDFAGFLLWMFTKMISWLVWAGPVIFLGIFLALPLILLALLLLPLYAFARVARISGLADRLWRARLFILGLLEDYTEVVLARAFWIDDRIERISRF